MKRFFTFILLAVISLFVSCKQEILSSDEAEMRIEIVNEDNKFYSDEEVVIRVYTNHDSFRVKAFDFDIAPELMEVGETYIKDKSLFKEFRSLPSITKSHSGVLKIVIEDETTGKELSFSEKYFAYLKDTQFKVRVLNDRKVNNDIVVVSDDDIKIRVESKVSPLVLKSIDSKLGTGDLLVGNEYSFDGGYHDFTIPKVQISDGRTYPLPTETIRMTFLDEVTGIEYNAGDGNGVQFLVTDKFRGGITLEPSVIKDGDNVVVRLTYNRNSFKISSSNAADCFMTDLWADPVDRTNDFSRAEGYSVNGYNDGVKLLYIDNVSVKEDKNGVLKVYIDDSKYSGETNIGLQAAYIAESEKETQISSDTPKPLVDRGRETIVTLQDNCKDASVSGKYKITAVSSDGTAVTNSFTDSSADFKYFSIRLNGNQLVFVGKETYDESKTPKAGPRSGKVTIKLANPQTTLQEKAELTINFIVRQRVYVHFGIANDIQNTFILHLPAIDRANGAVVKGELKSLDGVPMGGNNAILHVPIRSYLALRGWKSNNDFTLSNSNVNSYSPYSIDADNNFSISMYFHFSTANGADRDLSNYSTAFYHLNSTSGEALEVPEITTYLQNALRNMYYIMYNGYMKVSGWDYDKEAYDLRAFTYSHFYTDDSGNRYGTYWFEPYMFYKGWFANYNGRYWEYYY